MKEVTIDITRIIENGDNFERRFFNWLNDHKIYWRTLINQTKIMILEKDYSTIKGYWSEVETDKGIEMNKILRKLKEGDRIKITYLKPCINGSGGKNPYIGMEGIVVDLKDGYFDLFTGNSWLCGVKTGFYNLRYEFI